MTDTPELRRKLGIPLGANVTVLDLGKGLPMKTGGWTDEQIQNKTEAELDTMITSAEKGLENLRDVVRTEEDRLMDLRAIRSRKNVVGGV